MAIASAVKHPEASNPARPDGRRRYAAMPMAGVWRTGGRVTCALVTTGLLVTAWGALTPVNRARAALARVSVAGGRPGGATVQGAVAAATRMHVTVTLRPRDPGALAAYAQAVSTPGSALYRQYLTPPQFARRFGATRDQVVAVRDALRTRGLGPDRSAAGGCRCPSQRLPESSSRALGVGLQRLALPGAGPPSPPAPRPSSCRRRRRDPVDAWG